MSTKLIVIGFCLILLTSCNSNIEPANFVSGRVTRVISGQTIEVVIADTSEKTKVRIIGIDAPDLRQLPWGKTAKVRLSELVLGLPIELETEGSPKGDYPLGTLRDRFGRVNAHVWQEGVLVAHKLVREGCVLANTKYPHSYSNLLTNAQEYARALGYGIWNPNQAMRYTPNQFRDRAKNKY